jgi:3-oxoacyl-[acyl-carrier protein] reductase
MIDLSGKVMLVTGGSRGIGAVTVRTLAAAGAEVVLHYGRSRGEAERVAGECPAGRCRLVVGDLEDPAAPARVWAEAVGWRGRVDALVNNAALALTAGIEDEGWDAVWERTMRVNVVAAADFCREAIRHFRTRGGGVIVNVASRAAFRGDEPNYMQYAASKGALVALTKSIARGFAREGVVAYGVAPGWVRTEMAEQAVTERGMEALMRDVPMGVMAPPEDVASVIAFLVSGLARHATGTTIDVNGASYVR